MLYRLFFLCSSSSACYLSLSWELIWIWFGLELLLGFFFDDERVLQGENWLVFCWPIYWPQSPPYADIATLKQANLMSSYQHLYSKCLIFLPSWPVDLQTFWRSYIIAIYKLFDLFSVQFLYLAFFRRMLCCLFSHLILACLSFKQWKKSPTQQIYIKCVYT